MVNYDGRWNKGGHAKVLVLRTMDTKRVIASARFLDEGEFDEEYKRLMGEKDRWYASDQFIGRFLEVVVI